jgi:cytochrome c556
MPHMKVFAIAAAGLAATAAIALAQERALKPESQVKLRKSAYALMNYNFATLEAMAEGKRAYNQDEAGKAADWVANLSEVPKRFFGEGTDKVGETRARPEIWQKRADFDAKMDKMVAEAQKLPQAARTDAASLKKAVDATGDACGACHDDYRRK